MSALVSIHTIYINSSNIEKVILSVVWCYRFWSVCEGCSRAVHRRPGPSLWCCGGFLANGCRKSNLRHRHGVQHSRSGQGGWIWDRNDFYAQSVLKSTPNTSIYWIIASVDWNQAVFDITYEFCCGCENMELTWISFSTVEMGHVPCETWPIHGHIHGHICRKSWFLSCIQRQAILVLLSEEVKSFDDSCVVKGMPSFGIKNPEWEFYLQMKCERYWPYDDEVKQYGDITINLVRM